MRGRNPAKKNTALRRKEKKQKAFYCNKMNNKENKNWNKEPEKNFGVICITHWRTILKKQQSTFLERNEYSPDNFNQSYAEAVVQLRPQACNFIKKETPAEVFSCEFCETSKNNFSYRAPPVGTSGFMLHLLATK